MRIAQLLHQAYHKSNDEFVRAMFRQALHREADDRSLHEHLMLLDSGAPKNSIIIGLLNGAEARAIYYGPYALPEVPTVAGKLRQLLSLGHEHYVHHLYDELLCRTPDRAGFSGFVQQLQRGTHPLDVLNLILASEEWLKLIQSDRNTLARKILSLYLTRLHA